MAIMQVESVEIFRRGLTSAKANGKPSPLAFTNAKIITVKLATKEENVHFTRSYRKCMATGLMLGHMPRQAAQGKVTP